MTKTANLRRRTISSPIGRLIVIADDDGLVRILFATETLESAGFSDEDVPEADDHPLLDAAASQLDEYFTGERTTFDVPFNLHGTDFQKKRGWRLPTFPTATPRAMAARPRPSVGPVPSGPWVRPTVRTRSRSCCRAIESWAPTDPSPDSAAGSTSSNNCSTWSATNKLSPSDVLP